MRCASATIWAQIWHSRQRHSTICTSSPGSSRRLRIAGEVFLSFLQRGRPVLARFGRAEAFQIEAQARPGPGIPPAKMSQRVSLNDGEGLLPSLCSDEPRAERTDQRVRQRSTHIVRDFVFARFAERPVFARPNLWCIIFIIANVTGSSSKQRLVRGPRR